MTAQKMYETYCEDSDWKNYQGNQCPKWDELPVGIQQHWKAVADAADTGLDRFIRDRLQVMRDRPPMWAHTREAFAAQLAMLYDLAALGLPIGQQRVRAHELMHQIFCDGPSGHVELGATIDASDEAAEWCSATVDAARAAIDALEV